LSDPDSSLRLSHSPAINIISHNFLLYSICTHTYKTKYHLEHNENKTYIQIGWREHRAGGGGQKKWREEREEQRQEGLRKIFVMKTKRT
jgi:hypothetical protein